jgi:hypothetical protein
MTPGQYRVLAAANAKQQIAAQHGGKKQQHKERMR